MFKQFLRCVSTLLVLVMLVNMVPVQALGELQAGEIGQISGTKPITTTPTISTNSTEPATIVTEVPEGRSEYSKEFLLSNGLHMATVYAEPVHYEKDGKWEDIDNTLVANLDGTYKNTAGPWEVSFPQSFGSSQSISITKDGYTLSFGMPQRLTSGGNPGAVVMSADSTAEPFATTQAATATAQLDSKAELLAAKAEAEHPETVLDKLSSRLTYENVHSDTNVVYDLDSNRVKESVILAKQDATLRGFRYTLNTGAMIPVLEEDGTILLYSEDQRQIVMVMPAPYLLDAAYEISNDVAVTLTGSNGRYVMTYLLPQQWLADEARQWPVILDPVIQTSIDRSNIQDVLVCSNATISPYGSYLEVGYLSNRGISRTYLNFAELPPLTSADVVVKAEMQMRQMWRRSISVPAEVHKVTSRWNQEEITWGAQPTYDETIVDFVMGNNAVNYHWDVTDIVQEWYNDGEHFGLLFKTSNAIENAGVEKFRQFYSCNYGYDYRPMLCIEFRNNNGREGWWDYSSASAGRAGTGSVNSYSGNLVWTRSDMGFGGNRKPVSIGYTYNTNDAANNSFGMGYGWRSDFNQLLYQWDEDGDGTIQSDEPYYIWEDGDGTSHYFKYNSDKGKIVEADGLEMELTVNSSGDSKYILTDKDDNTWHFDTQGRLYKVENNQATKSSNLITYQDSTSKLIDTVTDGVGRKYQFEYGDDGILDSVAFLGAGTEAITTVTYSYTNGNLTQVKYKDNKTASYTYTDNHLLLTAEDIDGYKLNYTYFIEESKFAPPRIQSVVETDLTDENVTVSGGKLSFAYEQNQTKVQSSYTNADNEEVTESTLYYQFNNYGNTVAIQDDEGRAQYVGFARNDPSETTGKGNQLTLSSKLQNTVVNYFSDSSFESSTQWTSVNSAASSIATIGYLGSKSLQISGTANGYLQSPGITVKAGETYTFSGFVKVESGSAKLGITDGTTTNYSEESTAIDWVRLQISYTNSSETDKTVYAIFAATATAYLDCVQLEKMPTASRYNLVNNGDFASADGWTRNNLADGDLLTTAPSNHPVLSSNAYKITGEYTTAKSVKQTINVSGGEGDSYVFGGWAMGNSAALGEIENSGVTKDFGIKCTIYNGTEVVKEETAQFNPNVTQWQFVSGAIAATGDYTSITIEAVYTNNVNTVYFDGLQLFKEEFGVSYTYDDEGNVKSVIDLQKKTTEYEYDSDNNLTQIIQDENVKMTYTYWEGTHNVKTATTEEGLSYYFEYDGYGNNTMVSITSNGQTISSIADYTDNGDLLEFTKDALGNQTTYGYDEQTGLLDWVQYPEDTAATRTEYTYDNMYRTATVAATTDTALNLSANYTYEDDLLKTIQTPSTTYTFEYGDFSLRSAVKIGNRNLASYTYENGTNRLQRLDYGNGDRVEYTYDSLGRLILETYEDGETVSYAYDNSGNLATVTDSATGVVTTYYYDLLNRQSGYREQSANLDHTVKYEYDEDNNLASLTEIINGVTKTYSYTYDDDNRIISETVDGVTVEYTYDGFGRLENRVVKQDETVIQTSTPTYSAGKDSNTTTGQISSYNGYTYTYDDNGNILTISDGTNTTSYEYDSANQLIWEYNEAQCFAHNWEYDNAGNIRKRMEYVYSDGVLSQDYTTIEYGYNDDKGWGDLLTSYGSKTFDYDNIGNLTDDEEWEYTWQHGRQLASMTNGTTTWSYTYSADGLRTQKTDGTNSYTYTYNGSKLTVMAKGTDILYFSYDASGTPLAVIYNGVTYYYNTNLQGDILRIKDGSGNTVVSYAYDAWGKLLSTTGTLADSLGTINPLLYRGYVYDFETGLYYLQSRYYNPQWGRFKNLDDYIATGQGLNNSNMFTYCKNNTPNRDDPTGLCSRFLGIKIDCLRSTCESSKNYGKPGFLEQFLTHLARPRENGHTFSVGLAGSTSLGGASQGMSGVLSVDSSFNYALQETKSLGNGLGTGGSGGLVFTYTNASNVQDLAGASSAYGFTLVSILGISLDYITFSPASNPDTICNGLSLTLSLGGEADLHGTDNYTTSTPSWNPIIELRKLIFGE